MNAPEMHITKIEMTLYVPVFLQECEFYKALAVNESSTQTLICDFLRKQVFKTLLNQAAEVEAECAEAEYANDKSADRDKFYMLARLFTRTFTALTKSVKQVKLGDNLIHLEMQIFTPMHARRPLHNGEIRLWVVNHILHPVKNVALSLGEANPLHKDTFDKFAEELRKMADANDRFAHFSVTTVTRNEQI